MDVVCERCQTEYDFDDALVSERGTTVKCTNCGHQFKIYRPPTGLGTPAAAWILRRPDGSTVQFDSLAVLQKWIGDGRVTRSDQLSRNGTDWKTLGSIAELETFFALADSRNPRAAPAPTQTRPFGDIPPATPPNANTTAGWGKVELEGLPTKNGRAPGSAGMPGTQGANPAIPGRPSNATMATRPTVQAGNPAFASTLPGEGYSMGGAPAPTTAPREGFDFGDATNVIEKWGEAGRPPPRAAAPTPAPQPTTSQRGRRVTSDMVADDQVTTSQTADDLDAVLGRRRGGGSKTWLIVVGVVLVGAGAGAAIWRFGLLNHTTPATASVPNPPDRITAAVVRAETTARVATRPAYEEARDQLTALTATDPDEPRVRAARAEVLALWSEQQRQGAEDLEARAALNSSDAATLRAEAQVVRRDVTSGLDRARTDVAAAESNAARVPAGAERVRFERALGEATRVLGEMTSARRHLDAARNAGGGADVDLLSALLERDANDTDAAVVHLRALTSRDDVSARAHLALGRLLAQRGDPAASAEADAVLRAQGSNEEAQALSQAVTNHMPPFRAAGAVPATNVAGTPAVVDAGHAAVVAATDAGAAAVPGNVAANSGSSDSAHGRSYDQLVEEGERMSENGHRERALRAFMDAIAIRPNGSEAITGLGYVELDGGSASAAVSHFRHALEINPRYSEAMIGLGEAYKRSGNYADALRSYRDYLNINPGGSHAREAQSNVESLQRRLGGSTGTPAGTGTTGGTTGTTGTDTTPTPAPTPTPTPAPTPSTGGSGSGSGSQGGGSGGGSGDSPAAGSGGTATPTPAAPSGS